MRLFHTFLLSIFGTLLTASDYNLVVLGDTHFDAERYHASKPVHPFQIQERERNVSMWANGSSEAVLRAAAKKDTPDVPFVIQIGDLSQGDCDTPEDQAKMISDGFAKIKSFFNGKKLFSVIGNHDIRLAVPNVNPDLADKVFLPSLERELGKKTNKGNYFVRHGKDLYIFLGGYKMSDRDAFSFVSSAINQNKDARHIFYITHVPLLAWSYSHPTPGHDKLIPLLLSHNAIILSGHTHRNSIFTITKGGKKLTQLVVTSLGAEWKNDKPFEVFCDSLDKYMAGKKESYRKKEIVQKRVAELKKYKITTSDIYSAKSGFAVLNVKENSVTAELYLDDSGKPAKVLLLKGENK